MFFKLLKHRVWDIYSLCRIHVIARSILFCLAVAASFLLCFNCLCFGFSLPPFRSSSSLGEKTIHLALSFLLALIKPKCVPFAHHNVCDFMAHSVHWRWFFFFTSCAWCCYSQPIHTDRFTKTECAHTHTHTRCRKSNIDNKKNNKIK